MQEKRQRGTWSEIKFWHQMLQKNYKALPVPVTGVSEGMDGCVIWSTKTLKFISVPVVLKHLFRCLKLYLHHIQQINWSDTKRMQIHMQIGLFYCEVGACVFANPTLHIWPAHVPALRTSQFICHIQSLEPLFVDVFMTLFDVSFDLLWCLEDAVTSLSQLVNWTIYSFASSNQGNKTPYCSGLALVEWCYYAGVGETNIELTTNLMSGWND